MSSSTPVLSPITLETVHTPLFLPEVIIIIRRTICGCHPATMCGMSFNVSHSQTFPPKEASRTKPRETKTRRTRVHKVYSNFPFRACFRLNLLSTFNCCPCSFLPIHTLLYRLLSSPKPRPGSISTWCISPPQKIGSWVRCKTPQARKKLLIPQKKVHEHVTDRVVRVYRRSRRVTHKSGIKDPTSLVLGPLWRFPVIDRVDRSPVIDRVDRSPVVDRVDRSRAIDTVDRFRRFV